MKKLIFALAAAVTMVAGAAQAERYVMVTHGEGKDPFWPVVQKGGEDAARHVGADFEYIFNPSGDMGDMAKSITAAAATQPDGIVVSLPDPDALGGAIKAAVAAGIPVITMNSGLESSAEVGTKLVDSSNDPATIPTRAAAGLQANPDVDAVLSVGPHVCVGVQQAIDELGMSVHHSCFDLSPPVMDMINSGKVQYTIDQQQRLQGYMPVIVLHLYNNGAGLLPGANIPSGPGFVDKSNASSVAALAGVDR